MSQAVSSSAELFLMPHLIVCASTHVHMHNINCWQLLVFNLQGNVSGHNEFVVYNAYRVLPEYILKYVCRGWQTRKVARRAAPASAVQQPSVQRYSLPSHVHSSQLQHAASTHTPLPLQATILATACNNLLVSLSAGSGTTSAPSSAVTVSATTASAAGPAGSTLNPAGAASRNAPVRFDHCLLCGLGMAVCRCGLTSRGCCRYCHRRSSGCTCPVYHSATGEVLPYRCLTSVLRKGMRKLPV